MRARSGRVGLSARTRRRSGPDTSDRAALVAGNGTRPTRRVWRPKRQRPAPLAQILDDLARPGLALAPPGNPPAHRTLRPAEAAATCDADGREGSRSLVADESPASPVPVLEPERQPDPQPGPQTDLQPEPEPERHVESERQPGPQLKPGPGPATEPESEPVETPTSDLQGALGSLAVALAARGASVRPRIVQSSPHHLELCLDRPDPGAPSGWTVEADGAVWSLNAAAGHRKPTGATVAPLLVPVGQSDDDGQLHLDLEAEGILSLTGDLGTARRTLHALVAEVAGSDAEGPDIVVVGEPGALETLLPPRLTVQTWDDVTDAVSDRLRRSRQMMVDGGWPNAFIARGGQPDHVSLSPVLVVAATAPPPELLHLFQVPQPSTVAFVLLDATVPGASVLHCQPDGLTLVDLGLVCIPAATEATAVIAPWQAPRTEPPGDEPAHLPGEPPVSGEVEETSTAATPVPDVVVRVLGDIHVDGGAPLTPKQTAVVAYIALHRPVTAERLEDAIWPTVTARTRRKRLANMLSECRAALGRDHLPPSTRSRYTLGPGVVTDVELFDQLIDQAASEEPAPAADTLHTALDLVTGAVFGYRRADRGSYTWVDIENWQSMWDQRISRTAQQCAAAYLTTARAGDAVTVAQRMHQLMPCDSTLTACLLRACAAAGDTIAIEAAYQAHVAAVERLELGDVERSVTDLRDELHHRKPR